MLVTRHARNLRDVPGTTRSTPSQMGPTHTHRSTCISTLGRGLGFCFHLAIHDRAQAVGPHWEWSSIYHSPAPRPRAAGLQCDAVASGRHFGSKHMPHGMRRPVAGTARRQLVAGPFLPTTTFIMYAPLPLDRPCSQHTLCIQCFRVTGKSVKL